MGLQKEKEHPAGQGWFGLVCLLRGFFVLVWVLRVFCLFQFGFGGFFVCFRVFFCFGLGFF